MIVNVIKTVAPDAILYVPCNSIIEKVAIENKINTKLEAFADRNYNDNLTLVSRSEKNAVITNKEEVINHLLQMIIHQKVKTITGKLVTLQPETFCVHGDNKEAIELVKHIHDSLTEKGIYIA